MIHFFYILILVSILFLYPFLFEEPTFFSDDFFKINIAQLLTPILQIVTLLGITYFINIKLSDKNKKIEIAINEFDEIQKKLRNLEEVTFKYFEEKNKEHEILILKLLKELSNKTYFLNKLANEELVKYLTVSNKRKKEILILKQEITENYFKQNKEYPRSQQIKIESLFHQLLDDYTLEKMKLYK